MTVVFPSKNILTVEFTLKFGHDALQIYINMLYTDSTIGI